ncbi:hypothetical protein [Clostridium sp. UBA1652]|nr:hypothetical protein [Clostridium sp. UBA1652]
MPIPVQITLIICGTIVVTSAISTIGDVVKGKKERFIPSQGCNSECKEDE